MLCCCSFGYGRHDGVPGERTCNYPFDKQWSVLAYAFFPSDGRLHFDEAESWTVGSGRGTDLLWVAVHEIGHSLGLEHSNVRGTIMWPTYSYQANLRLHSDDIRGIQSLYGKAKKMLFVFSPGTNMPAIFESFNSNQSHTTNRQRRRRRRRRWWW